MTNKKQKKKLDAVEEQDALLKQDVTDTLPVDDMGITDVFRANDTLLDEGVWIEIPGTGNPAKDVKPDRIKLKYIDQLTFVKMIETEINKKQAKSKLNKAEPVSPAVRALITMELVASSRVVDWRIAGAPDYSAANALKYLKLSPKFDRFVNQSARDLTNFYTDSKEADEKK